MQVAQTLRTALDHFDRAQNKDVTWKAAVALASLNDHEGVKHIEDRIKDSEVMIEIYHDT